MWRRLRCLRPSATASKKRIIYRAHMVGRGSPSGQLLVTQDRHIKGDQKLTHENGSSTGRTRIPTLRKLLTSNGHWEFANGKSTYKHYEHEGRNDQSNLYELPRAVCACYSLLLSALDQPLDIIYSFSSFTTAYIQCTLS